MANSHHLPPSELEWVHELAKNELKPEASNIFNSTNRFDPKQLIEESTVEFLESLRDLFTIYTRVFNGYSEQNAKFTDIKVYGITNTAADFMLFRNNVKLVFANTAQGIISATFTQHNRDEIEVAGASAGNRDDHQKQSQEIIAQMGPFLDVIWTYQGERVNPARVVKYYLIEFVKASRTVQRTSPNQLLLKQIKALLQDKGIDL